MSEHEQPPEVRVEVWEQAPGAWRWRFVDDAGEVSLELSSNTTEHSQDAAVAAARLAYPDVPVEVLRRTRAATTARAAADPRRWLWAGATATLSLAMAAVALRYRRWWLAPAAPVIAHGIVSRLRQRLP